MKGVCIALLVTTATIILLGGCGGEDNKKDVAGQNNQTETETPITPVTPTTPTTPTTPDTPSDQAGGDTKQPEKKPIKNISEAIKRLEELGEIPKLNKDKDVAGPDENGNGVRDDLDAYVASLPDTEIQKRAMLQMFAALRYGLLVDVEDQKAVELGLSKSMDAVSCMFDRYGPEIADKKIKIIRSYAINTRARFEANNRFSVAKDGTDVESKNDGYCDE